MALSGKGKTSAKLEARARDGVVDHLAFLNAEALSRSFGAIFPPLDPSVHFFRLSIYHPILRCIFPPLDLPSTDFFTTLLLLNDDYFCACVFDDACIRRQFDEWQMYISKYINVSNVC